MKKIRSHEKNIEKKIICTKKSFAHTRSRKTEKQPQLKALSYNKQYEASMFNYVQG